eukprot:gene24719-32198_t
MNRRFRRALPTRAEPFGEWLPGGRPAGCGSPRSPRSRPRKWGVEAEREFGHLPIPAGRSRRPPSISTATDTSTLQPRLRHHFEAFALRLVVAMLAPLSVDQASWLMGKLWRHVLPLGRRNRRTLANLALILPQLSSAERRAIAAGMRENFGRVFIEAFRLKEIFDSPARFDLSTAGVLAEVAKAGGNAVIASLHMGNWEAASSATLKLGLKPAGVYRQLTNPIVEALLARTRQPFYPAGLYCRRPQGDIARKVISVVKNGGTLAIMADLRDDSGVHLPFLGHASSASAFPAFVARMTGVPLVAARLVRTHGVYFRAEAEIVGVPQTDDRHADIAEATRRLAAIFERWIHDCPEQWLWTHRNRVAQWRRVRHSLAARVCRERASATAELKRISPMHKTPRAFFKPLAIGAPDPYRELPVRLERMIHFVPPHNDKVRAKVGEIAKTVDVVLGNLEDAVPIDQKLAARRGLIEMGHMVDFKASGTGLWTRINCLNSSTSSKLRMAVLLSSLNPSRCITQRTFMGRMMGRGPRNIQRRRTRVTFALVRLGNL